MMQYINQAWEHVKAYKVWYLVGAGIATVAGVAMWFMKGNSGSKNMKKLR